MIALDNKTWLLAMELYDKDYGITQNVTIANDIINNIKKLPQAQQYYIRKVKAMEIIAGELIKLNK